MFLREGMFKIDCDRCGVRFDPVDGGVCSRCRQALCAEHLHGSLVQRIKVNLLGREATCPACRARGAATGTSAGAAR